ncbi:MAG: hypothetical protein NTW87_03770 [Planctomycetota bacterium]|nr:hypothetical protein [Planctomycetota bacterium]
MLWLNGKPGPALYLFMPKAATIENDGNITFVRFEKTWMALHLINATAGGVDAEATKAACSDSKGKETRPDDQIWSARTQAQTLCGMAIELGEQESHGDYDAFKAAVKSRSKVDASRLAEKRVDFVGCKGEQVGLVWAEGLPGVFRGGREHDWKNHWALWAHADGGKAPVSLGWKQGMLRVEAGGRVFEGTLKDGAYSFINQ